jgi:hypothetical protein
MMVVGNFHRASVGEEVAVYSRYFKTTPLIETTEASQDIPPGTVLRQNPALGYMCAAWYPDRGCHIEVGQVGSCNYSLDSDR